MLGQVGLISTYCCHVIYMYHMGYHSNGILLSGTNAKPDEILGQQVYSEAIPGKLGLCPS